MTLTATAGAQHATTYGRTARPRRIALGNADLPNETKGGVAYQTHYLANALSERGHAVTVFTFSPRFEEGRYSVVTLPSPAGPRFTKPYLYALALAKTDFSSFDVVHLMGDNYLVPRKGRPPMVRTFHGSAKDEVGAAVTLRRKAYQASLIPLETLGARRADYVTGVSEATRDRVPLVREVVPNGVDLRRFYPGPASDKEKHPTLLFVGTRAGRKRGQWLGDLWTRSIAPRLPGGAVLWTVAESPIEGDAIVNHGRVSLDTLADLYRRAWVFCLPSRYEGFGVPYVESMASGTAVVASPNPGAREVLRGGDYGVLAADDRIAETLVSLLQDGNRREELAAAGLIRAGQYDWQNVIAKYEAIYERLIAGYDKELMGTPSENE